MHFSSQMFVEQRACDVYRVVCIVDSEGHEATGSVEVP